MDDQNTANLPIVFYPILQSDMSGLSFPCRKWSKQTNQTISKHSKSIGLGYKQVNKVTNNKQNS